MDGDGADPAGRARDRNRLTRLQRDRANSGVRSGARDKERSGRLPRDVVRFPGDLIRRHDDEFGLAGSLIGESDNLVARGGGVNVRTGFGDHAAEVARRVIFQVTGKFPNEEEIPTPR